MSNDEENVSEVTPPSTTTTTTTQLSSTTIKHVNKTEIKRRGDKIKTGVFMGNMEDFKHFTKCLSCLFFTGNWENWRKRRLRKKDRNKNERHKHHERTTPKIKSHFEEERITLTIENFEGGGRLF